MEGGPAIYSRAAQGPVVSDPGRRRRPRPNPVTLLAFVIVAGEWSGLSRAITGGTPVLAVVLDMALVALAGYAVLAAIRQPPATRPPLVALLLASYMLLAALEILNPNVPSVLAGLEGFRKSAFTGLAFFVVVLTGSHDPRRFFQIFALGSIPALLWAARQSVMPMGIELDIIASSGASPITFHSGAALRAFAPTSGPFALGIIAASVVVIAFVRSLRGSRWWIAIAFLAAWDVGATITRANMAATIIALAVSATISFVRWRRMRGPLIATCAAGIVVAGAVVAVGAIDVPHTIRVLAVLLASLIAAGAVASQPSVRYRLQASIELAVRLSAGGRYLLPFVPVVLVGGLLVAESVGAPRPATPVTEEQVDPTPSSGDIGDLISGVANLLQDRNLQLRFGFWRDQLQAIAEEPLIGYGTSSAADGFGKYYNGTDSRSFHPHSLYLKPVLELGMTGGLLFLSILALVLRGAWNLVKIWPGFGLTALGIVAIVAISGLTGPMLDAYPMNLLFWATCGWIVRALTPRPPTLQVENA